MRWHLGSRPTAWLLERCARLLRVREAGEQLVRSSIVAYAAGDPFPLSAEEVQTVRYLIARCEGRADRYREGIGAARRRLDDLAGGEEVRNES